MWDLEILRFEKINTNLDSNGYHAYRARCHGGIIVLFEQGSQITSVFVPDQLAITTATERKGAS